MAEHICQGCRDAEKENKHTEQESFAMTMLKTYANTLKKVIAVLVIVIMCWLATIGGFVWYLNQFDYASETITIDAEQDGAGVNIVGGGNVNGAESPNSENK